MFRRSLTASLLIAWLLVLPTAVAAAPRSVDRSAVALAAQACGEDGPQASVTPEVAARTAKLVMVVQVAEQPSGTSGRARVDVLYVVKGDYDERTLTLGVEGCGAAEMAPIDLNKPGSLWVLAFHDAPREKNPALSRYLFQSYPGDERPETQDHWTRIDALAPLLNLMPPTDFGRPDVWPLGLIALGGVLLVGGARRFKRA